MRKIIENYDLDIEYGDGECSIAGAVLLHYMNPPDNIKAYYAHPEPTFLAEVVARSINTRIGEQLLVDWCVQAVDYCLIGDSKAAIRMMQKIISSTD